MQELLGPNMKPLPFRKHDPQESGAQYLEDLATGYWFSEALFTAVEMDIFSVLEAGGKHRGPNRPDSRPGLAGG